MRTFVKFARSFAQFAEISFSVRCQLGIGRLHGDGPARISVVAMSTPMQQMLEVSGIFQAKTQKEMKHGQA